MPLCDTQATGVDSTAEALIDTGSDVTIIGSSLAKKLRWRLRPADLDTVNAANGEPMPIKGACN